MWNLVFCKMPSGFHDVQQMIGITKKERREKIHEIILQSFSYLMHATPQTSFPYSESRESLTHSRHLMSKASLEYVIYITVCYAILKALIWQIEQMYPTFIMNRDRMYAPNVLRWD